MQDVKCQRNDRGKRGKYNINIIKQRYLSLTELKMIEIQKRKIDSPGQCGSVGWVSSHRPKGHGFNS